MLKGRPKALLPDGGTPDSFVIPAAPNDVKEWQTKGSILGFSSLLGAIIALPTSPVLSAAIIAAPWLMAALWWYSQHNQEITVRITSEGVFCSPPHQHLQWADAVRVEVQPQPEPTIRIRHGDGTTLDLPVPALRTEARDWIVACIEENLPDDHLPTLRLLL